MPGQSSISSTEKGTNGWAPSSMMILHGANVRTSIRFNGLEPSRQTDAKWRLRARIFGRHPLRPIWENETELFSAWNQYELTSDFLARVLGLNEMSHYAEFHPYSADISPLHEQIVAPLFAHYTADDGSFAAHLPSSYIYGSTRTYKLGSSGRKYQQFPCVEVRPPFGTEIYTLNPNLRKVQYWVRFVGPNGNSVEDGPHMIPPKAVSHWASLAGFGDSLGDSAGVIIGSDARVSSFVGTIHTGLGRLVGLDHTHPFFPG